MELKKDQEKNEAIPPEVIELNKEHACIMRGGKFRIMTELTDPVTGWRDCILSSREDIIALYSNQFKEVETQSDSKESNGENTKKTKQMNKASYWLSSKHRRQYKDFIFNPPNEKGVGDIPGYYNLWRGFNIAPKQGNCELYQNHVYENACESNMELFKYFMAWAARIVQAPGGERPGVAVVLKGLQGTGKGSMVEPFSEIFGPHFASMSNQVHLTGRFSGHLQTAVVAFCDEGTWGGDKTAEGILKEMITEPFRIFESKGEKPLRLKNNLNLFIASNNNWCIPAGLEERRFFVLEMSDRHKQDKSYFKPLKEQMRNGGSAALLYDLLHLDISDIDLRTAPKTRALLEQIENSMNYVQKWWYHVLLEGETRPGQGWQEMVIINDLHDDYKKFTRESRPNAITVEPPQFGRQLREMIPWIQDYRPRNENRQRCYLVPDLKICRDAFDRRLGFNIDWQ
jgi:hypothetical protein